MVGLTNDGERLRPSRLTGVARNARDHYHLLLLITAVPSSFSGSGAAGRSELARTASDAGHPAPTEPLSTGAL